MSQDHAKKIKQVGNIPARQGNKYVRKTISKRFRGSGARGWNPYGKMVGYRDVSTTTVKHKKSSRPVEITTIKRITKGKYIPAGEFKNTKGVKAA